jgi:hypothetical protein
MKKICTFRSKRQKASLQGPKTEFGAQNQYDRVTYPSFRNFIRSKKNYTFKGQKGENKPSEPSWFGNFIWRQKNYTIRGQKSENRMPKPKNGIWNPKSVWSCDISIVRCLVISYDNRDCRQLIKTDIL